MTARAPRTNRNSIDGPAIVAMYKSGRSMCNIAIQIGCSANMISNVIKEDGVVLRVRDSVPGARARKAAKPHGYNSKPTADAKPRPLEIWERPDFSAIRAAIARGINAKCLAATFRLPYAAAVAMVGAVSM